MRWPLLVLGLAVVLVAAACGSQGTIEATPETVVGTLPESTTEQVQVPEGDAAAGTDIFASAGCGSCHTLADSGATGTIGPNLDETKPSAEKTFVQVRDGGGGMPAFADQLSEQQIADVTAYVVQATSG
jgi:mono/diheme cytochrome c family protein